MLRSIYIITFICELCFSLVNICNHELAVVQVNNAECTLNELVAIKTHTTRRRKKHPQRKQHQQPHRKFVHLNKLICGQLI